MNYAQFKQMENQAITSRVYSAMRNEEDCDTLSDAVLWSMCKEWVEHDTTLSFEDFVAHVRKV